MENQEKYQNFSVEKSALVLSYVNTLGSLQNDMLTLTYSIIAFSKYWQLQVLGQKSLLPKLITKLPSSVAQLDAHVTSNEEVAGSTSAGLATFFCGDLIRRYFLLSFSPFR